MNWLRNNTLIPILFGIVASVLFGCKTGNEISGEVNPSEKLGAFYTDTFNLETKVVNFDSLISNNTYRLLVGKHNDPKFGTTTANAYAQFYSYYAVDNLGPNPEADSIYLQLQIESSNLPSYFYGPNSNPIKIVIYRLTSSINPDSAYFRQSAVPFGDSLASIIINGAQLDTSTSQLIPVGLPKSLAIEFIQNQSNFSSNDSFQNMFKGLAFISDESNQSIVGLINVELILLFHNQFGLDNLYHQDVAPIYASFKNNYFTAQNQITTDRSTGSLKNLGEGRYDSIPSSQLEDKCYIQPNTGVFTKVMFPNLLEFAENVKTKTHRDKVLINKAELVIEADVSDSANYLFPGQLYAFELGSSGIIQRTSSGAFQYLQNELAGIFGNSSRLLATFDSNKKEYVFGITSYVQALLDKTKPNNGLLIGATNRLVVDSRNNLYPYAILDRLSFYNSPLTKKKNIELRVYYTPF